MTTTDLVRLALKNEPRGFDEISGLGQKTGKTGRQVSSALRGCATFDNANVTWKLKDEQREKLANLPCDHFESDFPEFTGNVH